MNRPASATMTIITIQVAAGLSWPLSMSLMMLFVQLDGAAGPDAALALIR